MAQVRLVNVSKRFGDVRAVEAVNLPEDIWVGGDRTGGRPCWRLDALVDVVEPLGAEQYRYLSSPAGR